MHDAFVDCALQATHSVGSSRTGDPGPYSSEDARAPVLPGTDLVEAAALRLESERPLLETLARALPV
jgi:hypothetical protein